MLERAEDERGPSAREGSSYANQTYFPHALRPPDVAIHLYRGFEQKGYPKCDPAAEVKIKGEVQELKMHHTESGDNTHLIVKVGDQLYEICLCPAEFLKAMDCDFAKGDKLEITGSKAKMDGTDVILAREIVKGDNTLVVRDKDGTPAWTWMMKKG